MPDLEKVIKELESLRDICNAKSNMAIGNGKIAWAGYANTADDAIALLKEQEPVAPVLVGRMWECGKCHAPVGIFMDDQRDLFCRTCGRRVKWDD